MSILVTKNKQSMDSMIIDLASSPKQKKQQGFFAKSRKEYSKTSQFHFVLNTNITTRSVQQKGAEFQRELIRRLKWAAMYLKTNVSQFLKCRDEEAVPELKEFSLNLEIGPEKHMIHLDGYVFFAGFCQFNLKAVKDFFNAVLRGLSEGVYLHVSFIPDSLQQVRNYSHKDGFRLA